MVDKIIDGISEALHAVFGDSHEIYTESVKQDLKEPCFFVLCLNPTNEHFIGQRYFRTNQFCIHFFPATKKKNAECSDVREKLFDCLEVITVSGDLTRGTKMKSEMNDGVLNFFLNYDMFVDKVHQVTFMDSHDVNTDVKG